MVDPTPFKRAINWAKLRASDAERVIRERVKKPENVIFSTHAWERGDERGITLDAVFEILERGHVEGQPIKTGLGDWTCTVTRRMTGARVAGVVTIVFRRERLFVKTVMWMD